MSDDRLRDEIERFVNDVRRPLEQQLARCRSLSRLRCAMLSLRVSERRLYARALPRWLRWCAPLRVGLHVGKDESLPWGWRWRVEPGYDAVVALPLWLWWLIEHRWDFHRWALRHGFLVGPPNGLLREHRWTLRRLR